jgi:large subunit ribosomal protein L30
MTARKAAAEVLPTLRITLVRSTIGRPPGQEATVKSLGLRRLHQTVEHPDNASVRGMVNKVKHLVLVEEQR